MSTVRCRLADVQVKSALTAVRCSASLLEPEQEALHAELLDDIAHLEIAIGIVRVEAERLGFFRAAEIYGVAPVTALTDWELTKNREVTRAV